MPCLLLELIDGCYTINLYNFMLQCIVKRILSLLFSVEGMVLWKEWTQHIETFNIEELNEFFCMIQLVETALYLIL